MARGVKSTSLDDFGLDAVCDALLDGRSQAKIAEEVGVSQSALVRWIAQDVERSARVREARIAAARSYEEEATRLLTDARDAFELAKARELASHFRWKASKADPGGYGDKLAVEQRTTITDLTDEQLDAKLAKLLAAGG